MLSVPTLASGNIAIGKGPIKGIGNCRMGEVTALGTVLSELRNARGDPFKDRG